MSRILCIVVLFAVTNSLPHHTNENSFRDKVVSGPLPEGYVDALRKISERAVKTPSFDISSRPDHAIFADPLSLGYLYAVLNEQSVFGVENADIVKALQLSPEEVPKVYSALISRLNQDQDAVATNAVFTRKPNLNVSDALTALKSYRQVLDLVGNPQAVPTINGYLADHTHNLIRDHLLPSEDGFYNSTQAVVVNTLHLKKTLRTPFKSVGQRKFRYGKNKEEVRLVDTLELSDVPLRVLSSDDYTAVIIPLGQAETRNLEKSLVLIKPKECLGSFLKNHVGDIFKPDFIKSLVVRREGVTVQVPVLNYTLAREFATEYERTKKIPSFTSAICDSATERENFLQRIVQVSSISLNGEAVEVGEAVGVSVENVKQYRKEFGAGDGSSSNIDITTEASDPNLAGGVKSNKYNKNDYISITQEPSRSGIDMGEPGEPEPEVEAEPQPKAILDVDDRPVSLTKENQENQGVSNKNEKIIPVHIQTPEELNKNKNKDSKIKQGVKTGENTQGAGVDVGEFVFDTPFFAYIHDEDLGPVQFLAVRDVIASDQQSHVASEDFTEYAKLQRYVCLAPPAPGLLPPVNANVNAKQTNKKYQQHYQH